MKRKIEGREFTSNPKSKRLSYAW